MQGEDLKRFVLAGRAVFTLENTATGGRFTYRVVAKAGEDAPHFVGVLTGPDNVEDYTFLGTIFPDGAFVHSRKSRIGLEAPSAKAFAWAWPRIKAGGDLRTVRIMHEGRCGRCGRELTVPESIETGLGPECAKKVMGG